MRGGWQRSADVRRSRKEMAETAGGAGWGPGPAAGHEGADACLRALAGWNRSDRKLGRGLRFRSDAPRGWERLEKTTRWRRGRVLREL